MSLFPEEFYSNTQSTTASTEVDLLKDYAIDLKTGEILFDENNDAIIVEGIDAVIVQSWRKLNTPKLDNANDEGYFIYGKDFGSQFHKLIGKGKSYGDAYAQQMLIDCLVDGTYVTGINKFSTTLEKSSYTINYTMETIYGNYTDSMYIETD